MRLRASRFAVAPLTAALLLVAGSWQSWAAQPGVSPSPSPSLAPAASPPASPSPVSSPTPATRPSGSPAAPSPSASSSPAATSTPAQAACVSAACSRADLVNQVKDRLSGTLARALAAQQQLTDSLTQNAQQQEALKANVEAAKAKSDGLKSEISARDAKIQLTQDHVVQERQQIGRLARAEYQQPNSAIVRLLRSGSLKGWLVGAADLTAAAVRGQQLETALEQDLEGLNRDQAQQQSDLQQVDDLQAQQQADLKTLDGLRAEQEDTTRQLAGRISGARAELRGVDRQAPELADRVSQELDSETARLIDLADQQAWRQAQLSMDANPVQLAARSPSHSTHSHFVWPMPKGQVTQGFGPSQLWFEPAFNGFAHFHTGLDIAGPENDPVLAADDGQVVLAAGGSSGYGNYVVLAHAQGMTTLYAHLNQVLVKPGDQVKQGQTVGLEGSTGNSTGPHVHFEVRVNGLPVDPTPYLPSGPPSPEAA